MCVCVCAYAHVYVCICVCLWYLTAFNITVSLFHTIKEPCLLHVRRIRGQTVPEWRCLLFSSWKIFVWFTTLQVMFPMRGSTSNKQDISSGRSSVSTTDSPANSKLIALQEKCYHELIDVCRCIADSLGVNSSSIMNVQVRTLIHYVLSWLLPIQSVYSWLFLFIRKTDWCYHHIHVYVCMSAPQ